MLKNPLLIFQTIDQKKSLLYKEYFNQYRVFMLRAWIIWLLSALFMCYKYAIEVSPSVMANHLMSEFSLSGTQMGNLAASYFYAYLLFQIPAGLLIDRWGPRVVTTAAIFLCALGAYLFGIADTLFLANLGRFISGIGAAFAAVNCLKLIANWFPARQFAFMAGLMMTVGMLGAMGGQAPLAALLSHLGWRESMISISFGGAVVAVIFYLVVRDRASHHRAIDLTPQNESVFKSLRKILREPQSWYLSLYSGFAFAPVSAFGGLWGVPFLQEAYGYTQHMAAQGTTLIFLGFACGAPFFGWLSDRIGKRRPVMFWGTLTAAVCLVLILYLPNWTGDLAFGLLFLFGFSISTFLLCFSMIKESNAIYLAATGIGFMNAFDALCGAVSDPLTGKILDLMWTGAIVEGVRTFSLSAYHNALLILIAYFALALILLRPIRETHCKQVFPAGMP
jgi:nitrate/nitrite transporter NarK